METMGAYLSSMKMSFLLAAILYVGLGAVMLFWTDTTINVLCTLFGAVLLIYGIVTIAGFFLHDSALGTFHMELLLGIVAAGLGGLFLLTPAFLLSIVPVLLGVYIIIDCLVNLKRTLELIRMSYPLWWVSLLLSLAGIGMGALILYNPFPTQLFLFRVIGGVFAYIGISDLWVLFQVARLARGAAHMKQVIQADPIDVE